MACLPSMPAGSHLVFVSSVFGLVAPPGQAAYAASKFGVRGFAESLRHELRSAGTGVTVVHPGGVRTGIARSARTGHGVPADEAAAGLAEMDRLLRMPPHRAARSVLRAVGRRRGRVLVGPGSHALDLLVRLAPERYWSVVDRLAHLGRRLDERTSPLRAAPLRPTPPGVAPAPPPSRPRPGS
jgi:short-subunit dehydrogenase